MGCYIVSPGETDQGSLLAAGVLLSVVDTAISSAYGDQAGSGSSGQSSRDQNDPSSNGAATSTPGQPTIVIGGPGLSPGPPNETVSLCVYPKDALGRELKPFDPTLLLLSTKMNDSTLTPCPGIVWTPLLSGYSTNYIRPSSSYSLVLVYPPSITITQDVMVTQSGASVFSPANSALDCPKSVVLSSLVMATVWPYDQYNQPRFGLETAQSIRIHSFNAINPADNPKPNFEQPIVRNDCLLIPFTIQQPGQYSLEIRDNTDQLIIGGSPVQLAAVATLDPKTCLAYGAGLCSGFPGEHVSFSIDLKDQIGHAYYPEPTEEFLITATLVLDGSRTDMPITIKGSVAVISYVRPSSPTKVIDNYFIEITANGSFIAGGAFPLVAIASIPVVLDLSRCILSFTSATPPARALEPIHVTVQTFDNLGGKWLFGDNNGPSVFEVTWLSDLKPSATLSSSMNPLDEKNGEYSMSWIFEGPGVAVFALQKVPLSGSPFTIEIKDQSTQTDASLRGASLPDPSENISLAVDCFDQYGNPSPQLLANYNINISHDGQPVSYSMAGAGILSFQKVLNDPALASVDLALRDLSGLHSVPRSPYAIYWTNPQPDPSKCYVLWGDYRPQDASWVMIIACDANGDRRYQGGDLVQVSAVPAANSFNTILGVTDKQDGTYRIDFIPTAASSTLIITMNGTPIIGSPLTLPPTTSRFSKAVTKVPGSAEGLRAAFVGVEASFGLECLDTLGNQSSEGVDEVDPVVFTYTDNTIRLLPLDIVKVNVGTYTIVYTVPTDWPGSLFLLVLGDTLLTLD